jgi:hypothetical protein
MSFLGLDLEAEEVVGLWRFGLVFCCFGGGRLTLDLDLDLDFEMPLDELLGLRGSVVVLALFEEDFTEAITSEEIKTLFAF